MWDLGQPPPRKPSEGRLTDNVTEHLPEADRGRIDARLARAFNDPDPAKGLRAAKALAGELDRQHPGAAASLREGLEEVFTVRRLGLSGRLCRTLSSTNPIESMIEIVRDYAGRVKRWSSGEMALRWAAAGMGEVAKQFRRVNGYLHLPVLRVALQRATGTPVTLPGYNTKEDAA